MYCFLLFRKHYIVAQQGSVTLLHTFLPPNIEFSFLLKGPSLKVLKGLSLPAGCQLYLHCNCPRMSHQAIQQGLHTPSWSDSLLGDLLQQIPFMGITFKHLDGLMAIQGHGHNH